MSGIFERLKGDAAAEWRAYTNHAFVLGMGDGTLPEAAFRHYLVQDYLFLIQFARAYALGVTKADTLADMRACAAGLSAIVDVEMQLHVKLCGDWRITPEELESTSESRATIAYTRYVLEAGHRGDLLDLLCALSPCVIGYAEIGRDLAARQSSDAANPYAVWIEEYAGEAYQQVAQDARATLNRLAAENLTDARYPRLLELFRQATRLEADFWEMGMTGAD
ncbi:thiaminase II [Tepidamorphus sp. 3E244]|uniref:thiaminase II n=1 Tax=Tepidamorphus sp. 3E244 TaxID=3385498 RepID=UPI0038FD3263